jgi:PadR family transcriptional regulator PadR
MEREGYGLQLIERIKTLTKGKVVFSQGNVYPVLRELERAGLVTSREGEVTEARGGRPRIYYRITAEGLRAATDDAESVQGIFGLKPQTSGGGDV